MIVKVKLIESKQTLKVKLAESKHTFSTRFQNIQTVTKYIGGDAYIGDYEVIPTLEAQMLPTKDKVLTDNITVKSIPVFSTSNNSGGNTVYIAREV